MIVLMDKTAAIIYSMTKEERANPKIINASRKRRIAAGAGVPIAEVNRLCKIGSESETDDEADVRYVWWQRW